MERFYYLKILIIMKIKIGCVVMPLKTIIITSLVFIICVITPYFLAEFLIRKGGDDDVV